MRMGNHIIISIVLTISIWSLILNNERFRLKFTYHEDAYTTTFKDLSALASKKRKKILLENLIEI